MTTQTMTDDIVELTVPADSAYLSVLRTATAGLAARLDFTLDEIEDLRIAVDEACVLLLPIAARQPATELTCRFGIGEDTIAVLVSAPTDGTLNTEAFAWQVLATLAGDFTVEQRDGVAAIRFTKRRGSA